MSLPLPTSLSPSKVASFKECALASRYSAIDQLPEPPSPWAAKGTLVHRILELLHERSGQLGALLGTWHLLLPTNSQGAPRRR